MDASRFFAAVRQQLFGGHLSQDQVDGLNAITAGAAARGMAKDHLAYCLATAYHETAKTMMPIKEYGGSGYFYRMYDPASPMPNRAALAKREGALPGDGAMFFGRGYVQLTWRKNYERAGKLIGVDLVANPDAALDKDNAAKIMFEGMTIGLFTGKKLDDYIKPGAAPDFVSARRIINGTDKANEIAGYARLFASALA